MWCWQAMGTKDFKKLFRRAARVVDVYKDFSDQKLAVDIRIWLSKFAFTCAASLVRGDFR